MKVLVVSDTHGNDINVAIALDREYPVDALLHLGDSQEEEEEFVGDWMESSFETEEIGENEFALVYRILNS